jgi:hypothetical protein
MKRSVRTRAKRRKIYSRVSKRKQSWLGPLLLKCFVFVIIGVLTGLIYAKQKNDSILLGLKAQKIQSQLRVLSNEQESLQAQLNLKKTPDSLKASMKAHNLQLTNPTKKQIVTLNRPDPLTYSSPSRPIKSSSANPRKEDYTRLVKR